MNNLKPLTDQELEQANGGVLKSSQPIVTDQCSKASTKEACNALGDACLWDNNACRTVEQAEQGGIPSAQTRFI